jgi:hypothetical protein
MLLLNPTEHECEFRVPAVDTRGWEVIIDTAHPVGIVPESLLPAGPVKVGPFQTLALQRGK